MIVVYDVVDDVDDDDDGDDGDVFSFLFVACGP